MCLSQDDSAFYNGNDTRDRTNMSPVAALIGEIKCLLKEIESLKLLLYLVMKMFDSHRFAQLWPVGVLSVVFYPYICLLSRGLLLPVQFSGL